MLHVAIDGIQRAEKLQRGHLVLRSEHLLPRIPNQLPYTALQRTRALSVLRQTFQVPTKIEHFCDSFKLKAR